jgi:chitinase
MKINIFYITIGAVVIAGGWGLYAWVAPQVFPWAAPATPPASPVAMSPTPTPDGSSPTPSPATPTPSSPSPSPSPSSKPTPSPTPSTSSGSKSGPTTPTGVSVIALSPSSITLSWNASYDVNKVAGYKIYLGSTPVGTVTGQKFEVPGLTASSSYTFYVVAYDSKGLLSSASTKIIATTLAAGAATVIPTSTPITTGGKDTTPPAAPTGLTATAASGSEIDLSWTAATDNVGVTSYSVYENNVMLTGTAGTTYQNTNLLPNTTYTYTVVAYDAAGNASAKSSPASATTQASAATPPSTPPSAPPTDTTAPTTNITSPSNNATVSSTVTVTATATDDTGVINVEFYVDGTLKKSDNSSPYTYSLDTTTLSNGTHSLMTKAYDAAGNIGSSPTVNITVSNGTSTPDTTNPTATITKPTNNATVSSTITVSVTASDNVSVSKVQLYVDGSLQGTDTTSPYSFSLNTTSLTNGSHSLVAKATDPSGNVGSSPAVSITVSNSTGGGGSDTQAPSTPTGLQTTSIGTAHITFSWTASTDNVGVTGYNVYQGGSKVGVATSTSYRANNLTASTTYNFNVSAFDAAGNTSAQSATLTAKTNSNNNN